jgi:predicted PurR-regulated permease PerM
VKIQNPYRIGLFAGLGVLTAIVIGGAIGSLSTILTWVGAALFLSLGLDPLVTWLEKHGVKRPIAILITLVGVLGIFAGLVFALIPVIVEQVGNVVEQVQDGQLDSWIGGFLNWADHYIPWLDFDSIVAQALAAFTSADFLGGVLAVGAGIASGVAGFAIVIILVIYFTASLGSIKRGIYQFVPATKRPQFIDLAEQISQSVGRYVIGQVTLALCNGIASFLLLSFIFPIWTGPIKYAALLAFIAFLGSLIPLVGTLSASAIIVLSVYLFNDFNLVAVITVAIWYLVYMQVEAYVLNPRIMARAVKVPGVVVVIAALVGGTLLGILGALIAIPVAAAVQLIIREVIVPRQNEL